MQRWTWAIVTIAVLILAGESMLLLRAMDAVRREEDARRTQLASRCRAELARRLTEIQQQEDARPFTHWRHLYVPEDAVPGLVNLAVSPLARLSEDPAIIGWIQIDPDGAVHSPLQPRDEELSRLASAWSDDGRVQARMDELQARIAPALLRQPPPVAVTQAPSQTEIPTSSYGQVENYLNDKIAGNQRQSLQNSMTSRVVPTRADNLSSFTDPKADQRNAKLIAQAQVHQGDAQGALIACLPAGWEDAATTDVVIGAWHEAPARADTVLLLRDIAVSGRTWRQGVVFDRAHLQESVAQVLVDDPERPEGLAVQWGASAQAQPFAEPFTSLTATIVLPTVDGGVADRRRAIIGFGVALLIVTGLGILAIHWALRAVLRDIRRRQDFVAAVTHELKTPLTAIRLHAEMLRDGLVADPAKQHAYHGTIVAESGRLARLIGNVLDLARLERGERPLSPQLGDPAVVVAEALEAIGPHVRAQGFTLTVECDPLAASARFDRDALLQVVINLIDNAVKFAAAGDRAITIQIGRENGQVVLSVADSGPGVPAAELRHLFRPFWRGGRELTRRAPGTGIGLALVRSLMLGMGGSVSASNRPQGGLLVRCALAG